jgi:EmrB/QacA subfamily drug resistance transporter
MNKTMRDKTTNKTRDERGAEPEAGQQFTHQQILTVIGALVLSILMAALDQTIVTTAMPTIAGELHGLNQISWLITAYLLAQTISIPFYGKLGDLIGRKKLLLFSIVLFMAGSALCGIAQTMGQLIACRAFQGLGAGGLTVTAMAIIGDVVPARQRGKYLAFMLPVFGLATVFGPTLGGFFVEHLSWRWIFYINMPVGVAAFLAVVTKLHLPARPLGQHKIDYLGAGFLAVAVASLVLLTNWGGTNYAWASPIILGLGALVLVFGALFVWAESRAQDPVFPLELFRNRIFVSCVLLGAAVGLALFGSITFLPTFLQIATGVSPVDSGLLVLPFSLGLMAAAITTGQLISRTGRYKMFPIIGASLGSIGMFLLSTMSAATPILQIDCYMVVLGLGVGTVMPVLTQVAQNAVPRSKLGVATSGVNFFRQIAGALGVSVAGALFTSRLHVQLAKDLPAQALNQLGSGAASARIDPKAIANLPPQIHQAIVTAYGTALPSIFIDFVPILLAAVIVAIFLKEIPLANTTNTSPPDESKKPDEQTGKTDKKLARAEN